MILVVYLATDGYRLFIPRAKQVNIIRDVIVDSCRIGGVNMTQDMILN